MEGFACRACVIRIIECIAVGLDRLGAQRAVVEHALHAVAIARVACDAQQVACQFEVRIGAAGCLEALVLTGEARAERTAARRDEVFVRSPAAGSETLRIEKIKSLARRIEIGSLTQRQVARSRRTESIDVTVSVFA